MTKEQIKQVQKDNAIAGFILGVGTVILIELFIYYLLN